MQACEPAPAELVDMVARVARQLGVKSVPAVVTTSQAVPPLVWWFGSPARLVIPAKLFAGLSEAARTTIIAHELSHIARRDYLVRIVELLATTVFWWHPVVWLSCLKLHDLEEQCCDSRVLEFAPDYSKAYATALVDTMEFLVEPPRVCATMSAAVRSRCSLSRRIHMMAHRQTNRLTFLSALVTAAIVALPLAIAFAADPAPEQHSATPARMPAVLQGRVTDESGKPLAGVRV